MRLVTGLVNGRVYGAGFAMCSLARVGAKEKLKIEVNSDKSRGWWEVIGGGWVSRLQVKGMWRPG